jgi:hypothetical protein
MEPYLGFRYAGYTITLRTKDELLLNEGQYRSGFRFRKQAPIDLKQSTSQRVLDEIDGQYVRVKAHVRARVRQSMVDVRWMEEEKRWDGKVSRCEQQEARRVE